MNKENPAAYGLRRNKSQFFLFFLFFNHPVQGREGVIQATEVIDEPGGHCLFAIENGAYIIYFSKSFRLMRELAVTKSAICSWMRWK